jgi:hypothetical protein
VTDGRLGAAGVALAHVAAQVALAALGRRGATEVEALHEVAAQLGEPLARLERLDALRRDLQRQVLAQADGGADDRGVVGVGGHAHDERLVDLQLVGGKLLELGQRGEPGPEVVDGDADAHGPQLLEHVAGPAEVGHDLRLGDLDLQAGAREVVRGELAGDLGGQAAVQEAAGGQVHGHAQVQALRAPRWRTGAAPRRAPSASAA